VDDVLDFTGTTSQLGKPALNDLRSGLATAPVLFAAQEHPRLQPLVLRRFKSDGDVELAQQLVLESRGIERARELAADHARRAAHAVSPPFHDTSASSNPCE
jgi:geranyl diphosphate synthase